MISLRKATPEDLVFYFELRSDPSARKFHFNTEPIDLATHKAWFSAKLKDSNSRLFVIERERKKIGQVRIDLEGAAGEMDIAIVSEERGKGYAREAIEAAVREAFESMPALEKVNAYIKPENVASQKSFVKAGFQTQDKVVYKGHECVLMTYERV